MTARIARTSVHRLSRAGAFALVASVLAGCGVQPDTIPLGALPDDYRTNHPIVITEEQQYRDIPVGMSDRKLSALQRTAVRGFIAEYDRSTTPFVHILRPAGSANARAAATLAGQIFELLVAEGVPVGSVASSTYDAGDPAALAPIRLSYTAMVARTGPCGQWPEDLTHHKDNRHYANFGCAYQNNLAAQLANPADLLGPRPPSEINTERRTTTIGDYQTDDIDFDAELEY